MSFVSSVAATPERELSDATDRLVTATFDDAIRRHEPRDKIVLLAVGGYGRRELAPYSDLDLLLVHDAKRLDDSFVQSLWYPLWDAGFKVGHAVRTPRETLEMIRVDLDSATAMVTARVLAGDEKFGERVIEKVRSKLRRRGRHWISELHERVVARHATAGEVAYLLEPDLKEGLGGLRDIHAIRWANAVGFHIPESDLRTLEECNSTLMSIRFALHRTTGRAGDVLHLQDQQVVARQAGYPDDDALMAAIATVGRQVMWISNETWARLDPPRNRSRARQRLAPGVSFVNGEILLDGDTDPEVDPTLVLRVATAAARKNARINRDSLDRLGRFARTWPEPWPTGASDDLVALMLEGERAIPVWEALEQRDLVSRVLPEWGAVRCRPQRNAFHRFTVDRHLWQTAANASDLAERVARPDLLVLGALFHDLGKGYPGDHTEAGMRLFADIGPRMGLNEADVQTTMKLIQHHLLLPDIATRRDVSDESTIAHVADLVGDLGTLELLAALTEADARATGPTAWGGWKQELVRVLVSRVRQALAGDVMDTAEWRLFPDSLTLAEMATKELSVRASDAMVTVVSRDRPGLFTSVAGVLALHGLDIFSAEAHSDEQGMAASRFHLRVPPIDGWSDVLRDVNAAFRGNLDIDSGLRERAATYSRRRRESALGPQPPAVRFDDSASSNATVIEVHAPDRIGLLREISKVFADERLDIRHARIVTMGDNVVDTFYVREADGSKVEREDRRDTLTAALLKAID